MTMLPTLLFVSTMVSSNSMSMLGYNLDSTGSTDDLGGCGWSKCYNCIGKDGKPVSKIIWNI